MSVPEIELVTDGLNLERSTEQLIGLSSEEEPQSIEVERG